MANMKDGRKALGSYGEMVACQHLLGKGYHLIKQNWRCRSGELDLIMKDPSGSLIIVEVRTRRYRSDQQVMQYGSAAESINARKQQQVYQTTNVFLSQNKEWYDMPIRFDVITVELNIDTNISKVVHIEGAF